MHVSLNWIELSDNIHAISQSVTASLAHPNGCAAGQAITRDSDILKGPVGDARAFPVLNLLCALQRISVVKSNQALSSSLEAWYLPLPTRISAISQVAPHRLLQKTEPTGDGDHYSFDHRRGSADL